MGSVSTGAGRESDDATIRKIDCVQLAVSDLDVAIRFYARLGHDVLWRREKQAGLRMPDTDAELVVQTERPHTEIDLLVRSADEGAQRFVEGGGRILEGPFDIEIGRCVVVEDPWANRVVLVDMTRGPLTT